MAELSKKRKIRSGHRGSVTKTTAQVYEALEDVEANMSKLKQMKTTLQEKLDILQKLDDEIIDLIDNDDELEGEIERADSFRERIHLALIDIETKLSSVMRPPSPRAL